MNDDPSVLEVDALAQQIRREKQLDLLGQTDLERIKTVGALSLGGEMETGDYILQIVITDGLAKEKQKIATQFVQFELTQ